MSLVDLARRLLDAAKDGNEAEVTFLLASGAPFTTDWVSCCQMAVFEGLNIFIQNETISLSLLFLVMHPLICIDFYLAIVEESMVHTTFEIY